MATAARIALTAATTLLAALAAAPAHADSQSRATAGPTISQGANGTEQTLMCPPDENVLGGGFAVSAPAGRTLGSEPGDVLTSRPDPDATGWIVAVKKSLESGSQDAAFADLTLYVVCTEGEMSPGD
ncbi:MAG TPA: hypothetical protein VFU65_02135 [Actinocrinis sp.]|nr:hypothetical protein [Actinocrinis sp.]